MSDPVSTFDKKRASGYDQRILWGIPGYEGLHALTRDILEEALPQDARVLVAGAGTGMELLTLGAAKPGWRFTAVDPSPDMLSVLNARVKDAALADRVTPYNALVKDIPAAETGFDGATSLLVSHFISDQKERTAYFRSLFDRMKPGAALAFADIYGDRQDPAYQALYAAYKGRLRRSGLPKEELDGLFKRLDADFAILPETRLMELATAAGFTTPALYWKGLIYGAWTARKP